MARIEREFKLADGAAVNGLECTAQGVNLAGQPLLKTTIRGLSPLPPDELAALMKAAYGRDFDGVALWRGLDVAARALNDGDLPRAMVASLQLRLPDLDVDGAARLADSGPALSKQYDPDEPRDWRGRWTADGGAGSGNSAGTTSSRIHSGVHSSEQRSAKPTNLTSLRSSEVDDGESTTASAVGSTTDVVPEVNPETLSPAAYMGRFHDWVVADYAAYLKSKGEIVRTEVWFQMADGSAGARLDILALDPHTHLIYGVEVKTGDRPGFTPGQLAVYPHLMWGESVVTRSMKVTALGVLPDIPLRPIPIMLMYQKNEFFGPEIDEIDPKKMSRYYWKVSS